ncbi:UDP-N-acetylglucosamine 2-epimerase (non-hydrolyzing) [Billgrantia pellis]|uniref:UDP-N-acetylglucosamine 2-epimerase (Non-hydrolyzing) n=1 Tax=Billgrantia pellis TaxID=2606936 RepID=A0A7V7G404_9GAMM|nr:UDP-N-acetylglucosamine 2-epimerase (non-hydrolyzing) [Halomonas pellis]KAA0012910.1 UDP-N-acetylglucosamine 2-epimerase (non-hydrolyzing) [Halomonas pellis]
MLRVMTIVGTRPEIIRLSRILPKLDQNFNHFLLHTGQNSDHELNDIFFEQLELRMPDVQLSAAGDTPAETIGRTLIAVDKELERIKPQAVLILGDTNSALAAISAKRRGITVFHMEAGNRCFDENVPEEINRRIVDHISDYNLPYSRIARENLLREGIPSNRIIRTGSPLREVLEYYANAIQRSTVLETLKLHQGNYYLVSAHRQENVDNPARLGKLVEVLKSLAEHDDIPIIFSTHPRTRKRLEKTKTSLPPSVHLYKPFGFLDYVKLQVNSRTVLSDSGTITEESSILGFSALNLRDTHERPEGMEEAAVMMVGLEVERVLQGLKLLKEASSAPPSVDDYQSAIISDKIVRLIFSHAGQPSNLDA